MKLPAKKTIFVLCNALIFTFIVYVPRAIPASNDNLLKDAGFEQKLSADQGGWILFDESRFSSDKAHDGNQSVFNWGFSRTVPSPPFLLGTASGSYQEFSADPGTRWRLTGYAFTPTALEGVTAFGIVQVSFFDEQGNDLGTVETAETKGPLAKASKQLNSQSPVGEWIFLDTGVATAPANTAKIHAFTLFVDYSGSEISQGVYFDDLKLCSLDPDDDGSDCK